MDHTVDGERRIYEIIVFSSGDDGDDGSVERAGECRLVFARYTVRISAELAAILARYLFPSSVSSQQYLNSTFKWVTAFESLLIHH
jgi:hypothetical protein